MADYTLSFSGAEIDALLTKAKNIEQINGKSAYEIAVEQGFAGTEEEFISSLKGEKGEPGKDITETQAIAAVATGEPNFSEKTVTSAAFSANLATTATMGAGWTGAFPTYTHEAGSTENLSFPTAITKGEFIEIAYTQSGTNTANTFNIIFATTAAGTSGQGARNGVYYSTTFLIEATDNYEYLNIVPTSGWSGTFTLTGVKKATSLNSASLSVKGMTEIVKGTNNIKGGGGRVMTGSYNTANGYRAMHANTTGSHNLSNGYNSLQSNTDGSKNVANGSQAMVSNTTGSSNTVNGYAAMHTNITGSSNTANGSLALYLNTTGSNNIGIGGDAFRGNTTGSNNTAVGYRAGWLLSEGSTEQKTANQSVFIGANTKGSADNQTNQIVIGCNSIGNGSNTITLGNNAITSLRCQVTAITALSDIRTKEDVEAANLDMCYDDVKRLPIHRYKYKDFTGVHLDKHVTGFLADDVEQVFPKSVQKSDQYFPVLDENGEQVYEDIEETDADGNVTVRKVEKMFLLEDVKNITMTEAVPTLWGAVQKLIEEIEELKERLA